MSEMMFFEIPTYVDVEEFCKRIRPHWPGWKLLDVDVWLVGATVKVDDVDLAALLRTVEAAIAELGLLAIRYCLDGRFYVMDGLACRGRHGRRDLGSGSAGCVTSEVGPRRSVRTTRSPGRAARR